jgi:hypothetical protein
MGLDAENVTDICEGGFNVTVCDEGNTTIWYYSVDNNPNVETAKNITVKIDTTPPGLTGCGIIHPMISTTQWCI